LPKARIRLPPFDSPRGASLDGQQFGDAGGKSASGSRSLRPAQARVILECGRLACEALSAIMGMVYGPSIPVRCVFRSSPRKTARRVQRDPRQMILLETLA
jgi:hypothetical protein